MVAGGGIAGAVSAPFVSTWYIAAIALIVLSAAAGWWLHNRHISELASVASATRLSTYAELSKLYVDVIPIWIRQVETARLQTQEAVTALTREFADIVTKLEAALNLSINAATKFRGQGNQGIVEAMTYSRSDLLAIVDSLRLAQQARDSMLAETKYTEELRTMAGEVQQIALQMKLLTLNAAIEAARAGEQGKSFGILANEMRKLSAVSNETGVRMATKVEVIAAAISAIAKRSQDSSSHETSSVSRAESSIQDVLKRFENVTVRLTESAADMQKESTEVRNEISDALVLLQFQDRVSQILSHVTQNMDDLCGRLHQFGTQQHSEGEIDLNAWLNEMIGTFSTEEEFRNLQKQPLTLVKKHETTYF